MDQDKRKAYAGQLEAANRELWRAAMEILKTTDPDDDDDAEVRHAAEIITCTTYAIDECISMIDK